MALISGFFTAIGALTGLTVYLAVLEVVLRKTGLVNTSIQKQFETVQPTKKGAKK